MTQYAILVCLVGAALLGLADVTPRVCRGAGLTAVSFTSPGLLNTVTVTRGSLGSFTYSVTDLIGVSLAQFASVGDGLHLSLGIDGTLPTAGSRDTLITDNRIDTGVLNPGRLVSGTEGQTIPVTATTPGMALLFNAPVVNGPGPDLVLFELEANNNTIGDRFFLRVLDVTSVTGSPNYTIDGTAGPATLFGTTSTSLTYDLGGSLPLLNAYQYTASPGSLQSLQTNTAGTLSNFVNLGWRAIGIDLSDLDVASGASITALYLQSATTGGAVDPLFVAGLPDPIPEPTTLALVGLMSATGLGLYVRRGFGSGRR